MKDDPRKLDADLEQLKSRQRAQLLRNIPETDTFTKRTIEKWSRDGVMLPAEQQKELLRNTCAAELGLAGEIQETTWQALQREVEQRDKRIEELTRALLFVQQWTQSPLGEGVVPSSVWAVELLDKAKLLFVTATPERASGEGLGVKALGGAGFCEVMVEGPTTEWLIKQGFLCKFTYKAPETDLDVKGLAVTASGDFNAKALRARVVDSHLVGDAVQHYRTFADGKRAIVFATDVQTAEEMAAEFRAQGYTAVALSGETDQGERDRELSLFESGQTQVLVNVDLFDEGVVPSSVWAVVNAALNAPEIKE